MNHQFPHDLIDAAIDFFSGLVPAALGAAVAVTYERGLTWWQRFIQWSVGVCVSYFFTGATRVLSPWDLDPFVINAIGFVFGMIAFKAMPQLIAGSAAVAGKLPGTVSDRLISFLPKKKDDQ